MSHHHPEDINPERPRPGNKFSAAEDKYWQAEMDRQTDIVEQELQNTVDWFDEVVFPAVESGSGSDWPIKADADYYFEMTPGAFKNSRLILKDTEIVHARDAVEIGGRRSPELNLGQIYSALEQTVIDQPELKVRMESDAGEALEDSSQEIKSENLMKITRSQLSQIIQEEIQLSDDNKEIAIAALKKKLEAEGGAMGAEDAKETAETAVGVTMDDDDFAALAQDADIETHESGDVVDTTGLAEANTMKITRQQLRQIVQEAISFDVDYLDSIGSQEMADAKRAVGEDPAAQAAHLGIGVEDWYTIRRELDDHYEDRHMEDQMAFDDDPDLDDDGMLSVGELVKMTQNIADDIKEDKMKITRRQLRQLIKEELNILREADPAVPPVAEDRVPVQGDIHRIEFPMQAYKLSGRHGKTPSNPMGHDEFLPIMTIFAGNHIILSDVIGDNNAIAILGEVTNTSKGSSGQWQDFRAIKGAWIEVKVIKTMELGLFHDCIAGLYKNGDYLADFDECF